VILGVSPDTPAKHRKFKAKFQLPFTLIADTDHAVSEAYGVWVEKNMMGHKYMGVARTTFIIDGNGRIAAVFEKVNPMGHAAQVADTIDGMRAPA
jgi:peroxiredoxin Q/BCP